MSTRVRSYSKINLGLAIGPARHDGFHGLATLYQTLALHDWVTVKVSTRSRVERSGATIGSGPPAIRLTTNHPFVPVDARNTAWKVVERALARMEIAAEVHIHIEKALPVQGGMGAGSANAAAALVGLERELGWALPDAERLALAADVGSDVPLFLVGGAVMGTGRGEVVAPMRDPGATPCVMALPALGVSTPLAFRDWDARHPPVPGLTSGLQTDRLEQLSRVYSSVLGSAGFYRASEISIGTDAAPDTSGIVGGSNRSESSVTDAGNQSSPDDRAEDSQASLLALVRTGIENDFEEVVFPQYPLLREIKRELMGVDSASPALYAALSGSGSALFGLYRSQADAQAAQARVQASGCRAILTSTLPRSEYWQTMFAE